MAYDTWPENPLRDVTLRKVELANPGTVHKRVDNPPDKTPKPGARTCTAILVEAVMLPEVPLISRRNEPRGVEASTEMVKLLNPFVGLVSNDAERPCGNAGTARFTLPVNPPTA